MASILYIDSLAPDRAKTLAQAVNNAVTYGLGLMTGFFISGALYEKAGSYFLFMVSGFIALSGGILFWRFPMVDRQSNKPASRSV
jgi:PPP family 3-phenylpropionic acid transporter